MKCGVRRNRSPRAVLGGNSNAFNNYIVDGKKERKTIYTVPDTMGQRRKQ